LFGNNTIRDIKYDCQGSATSVQYDTPEDYLKWDDYTTWAALKNSKESQSIIKDLEQRKLIKVAYEQSSHINSEVFSSILTKNKVRKQIEEEIAEKAATTCSSVTTYRFDTNMTMIVQSAGGEEPMNVAAQLTASGTFDMVNKLARMLMDMNMNLGQEGKQIVSADYYLSGGWMYMKMGLPGIVTDQWVKIRAPEEIFAQQNQLGQQVVKSADAGGRLPG
jgi:hypothetical protein